MDDSLFSAKPFGSTVKSYRSVSSSFQPSNSSQSLVYDQHQLSVYTMPVGLSTNAFSNSSSATATSPPSSIGISSPTSDTHRSPIGGGSTSDASSGRHHDMYVLNSSGQSSPAGGVDNRYRHQYNENTRQHQSFYDRSPVRQQPQPQFVSHHYEQPIIYQHQQPPVLPPKPSTSPYRSVYQITQVNSYPRDDNYCYDYNCK